MANEEPDTSPAEEELSDLDGDEGLEALVAMSCPHCEHVAMHDVMGRAFWDGVDYVSNTQLSAATEWRFLQCQKCGQICVDSRLDHGLGLTANANVTYPAARELSKDVPEALREEWDEAQICFRNGALKSCAGAVRRTVEGTCSEHGISERTLDLSLKAMIEQGVIDQTLFEWATMLRLVGNAGAHYGENISVEDVQDALSFTEALLDHIYVLRKRFEAFRTRRDAAKAAASQT